MAQPLPYERDYDFEGFQSTHPSTPLPGDKVNLELDQVAETTNQIRDRIARLQDDDLALKRKSVGYDQLKDELNGFGFNPPSEWATATLYAARDTVFHESAFYRCEVAHTSATFSTDLAAGKWELVADFTASTTAAQVAQAAAEAAQVAAESAETTATAAKASAITSAANAATSADSAATSEASAADSASEAGTSASSAGNSATAASTSATSAATSASAAASSATAASTSADEAAAAVADKLDRNANLSDLASASTALSNLGGMAAVDDATALKALDTTELTGALRKDGEKAGTFLFQSGDYSTEATTDTAEGVYVKADAIATNVGIWVRQFEGGLDPEWFVEDADNDYTNALVRATAIGKRVDGRDKTYDIAKATDDRIIQLPANTRWKDIVLRDATPQASRTDSHRPIYSDQDNIELLGLTIDRNGDGSTGTIANAAAVYLSNSSGHLIDRLEVFGDDKGVGLVMAFCDRFNLVRPYIHDMFYNVTDDPGDDSVVGVTLSACYDFELVHPRVHNMGGEWVGQAQAIIYSRGIGIGLGCHDFIVKGGDIYKLDEGYDLSGSDGNYNFKLIGTQARECSVWGHKTAHYHRHGYLIGCIADKCGSAGFTSSGEAEEASAFPVFVQFINCQAYDTGYNNTGRGTSQPAGFLFSDVDLPLFAKYEQHMVNCIAIDSQDTPTMYDGARCEVAQASGRNITNEGFIASGYTNAKSTGFSYPSCRAYTNQVHSNSNSTDWNNPTYEAVPFDVTDYDGMVMTPVGQPSHGFLIQRTGFYRVRGEVAFSPDASGRRAAQVARKRGATTTALGAPSVEPGNATQSTVRVEYTGYFQKGDFALIQSAQNSGAALNVIQNSWADCIFANGFDQ